MKLDQNLNKDGRGKYALVKLRELANYDRWTSEVYEDVDGLIADGIIDLGNTPNTEFFVIRLQDKYSAPALAAYAMAAFPDDQEYAMEVLNLAKKAAEYFDKRMPD